MDIQEQKKQLRQLIRERKRQATTEQKLHASHLIFQEIEHLPEFQHAQTILLYWSMKDEVHTHDFVMKWYEKKTIVLPIVEKDRLVLRVFTGPNCMVEGMSFGIMEPLKGPVVNEKSIEMGVIPGVAFDNTGNRMGRGKAYYDKLLQGRKFFTVGVCFDFQLVQQVPVDSRDIPMDRVVFA